MPQLIPTSRWADYGWALYPVGAYLIALPLVELVTRTYPASPSTVAWRFGFAALAFTNLGTLLLGFLTVGLGAMIRGNRIVLRIVAVLAFLGAIGVLGAIPFYVLDGLQIRNATPPNTQLLVLKSGITAVTAALLGVLSFVGIGVGAWRASRAASRQEGKGPVRIGELVYSNLSGGVSK